MKRPVFFLTDFGTRDPFVGIMKAIVADISQGSPLIDLTNNIPPQDVVSGALALEDSFNWLPLDSVVCAVVDPGVGTDRRAVVVQIGRRYLVGPDNGLFAPILDRAKDWKIVEIQEEFREINHERSFTFHGRDVFAPAAGYVARGSDFELLGERREEYHPLDFPRPHAEGDGSLLLSVAAIDHFGNITLNLTRRAARDICPWLLEGDATITLGEASISGLSRTFGDVPEGEPLFYWNSAGRLEIAVNHGNAAEEFKARRGMPIRLAKPA